MKKTSVQVQVYESFLCLPQNQLFNRFTTLNVVGGGGVDEEDAAQAHDNHDGSSPSGGSIHPELKVVTATTNEADGAPALGDADNNGKPQSSADEFKRRRQELHKRLEILHQQINF